MLKLNASHALTPLYKVFLFGRFRIERRDSQGFYQPLRPEKWDRQSPQRVISYLLLTPGRHALKDLLLEALCPDEPLDRAQAILTQALSLVRSVLVDDQGCSLLLPRKANSQKPLMLAGRKQIWCDWDAFQAMLIQAQAQEQQNGDPLPLWEAAYALSQEEFLLEERYNDWCQSVRDRTEGDQRLCLLHLADCYQKCGRSADAERILRAWLSAHARDQDVLCRLMDVLAAQGRRQEALTWYERVTKMMDEEGMEIAEHARQRAEALRMRQDQASSGAFLQEPISAAMPSPFFTQAVTQDIIDGGYTPERGFMNPLRRQIVGHALKGAGAAIIASHNIALGSEIAERLTKALTRPSSIDEKTLLYLEKRIEHYWQDRNSVALPAWDLLSYVLADLQKMTMLLEGSLYPAMRTRLCSITGTAAMLVGELYYDLSNYERSQVFQDLAIRSAHEAENTALEAVAWGRNSFAWTYSGNLDEARNSIQQARCLTGNVNSTIRTWLAAVEAEIQSKLGDRKACFNALKEAASLEDRTYQLSDCYWIHFDRSLLAGYQGVSFLNLSYTGYEDLVPRAQTILQKALHLLDPSLQRRRPTLLIDLAGTYVQKKNIEQACEYAIQAVTIALQMNSRVLLQRFLALRNHLEPWKETRYVKNLDGCVKSLLLAAKRPEEEIV